MAQYCDHGGYEPHRMGDGECGLCEDIAELRAKLRAALAVVQAADKVDVDVSTPKAVRALYDYDMARQALRDLLDGK